MLLEHLRISKILLYSAVHLHLEGRKLFFEAQHFHMLNQEDRWFERNRRKTFASIEGKYKTTINRGDSFRIVF